MRAIRFAVAQEKDVTVSASDSRPSRGLQILRKTLALLATGLVTLLGLVVVTFAIGHFLPTDPVIAIVGDRAPADVYHRVYLELRLDQPLYVQLFFRAHDLLTGNFGISATTGQPIIRDIGTFLPATIELATFALLIGAGLGVPLGFTAARYVGRWPDHLARILALGQAIPIFWLGLVALLVFYARLGWVGGPGKLDVSYLYSVPTVTGITTIDALLSDDEGAFINALSHLVLPGGILGLVSLGSISRMTRAFVLAQSRKDYVNVARLKGLGEGAILRRHILPTIAGPLIATIAWTYAYLLEGAVLTETVFARPGLGLYITQSLFAADLRAVLAATFVVGVAFTGLNLAAELLQGALDPRARVR